MLSKINLGPSIIVAMLVNLMHVTYLFFFFLSNIWWVSNNFLINCWVIDWDSHCPLFPTTWEEWEVGNYQLPDVVHSPSWNETQDFPGPAQRLPWITPGCINTSQETQFHLAMAVLLLSHWLQDHFSQSNPFCSSYTFGPAMVAFWKGEA